MKALQIHAGPVALARLRERGLQPADITAIAAAAGGPKGLSLIPLDQYLFGEWLPRSAQTVHLLGASIGAWLLAMACFDKPVAALQRLADDYINQRYEQQPGRLPSAHDASAIFGAQLRRHFDGREQQVLGHPRYRLHVFTSRGRHILRREGRWRTPAGYLGAFATNIVSRRAMGAWLERVVFSDGRDSLPLPLTDFPTQQVALSAANLRPSILASCSIPFWLEAVTGIPGAPPGAYWDGGITDYHLHLDYAAMPAPGLVLYPHFQASIVPGWLDKGLKRRHRATACLDNVVVLSPRPEWVKALPNGKLPDRQDFKRYSGDVPGRIAVWHQAVSESRRLADEFAAMVERGSPIEALPLA